MVLEMTHTISGTDISRHAEPGNGTRMPHKCRDKTSRLVMLVNGGASAFTLALVGALALGRERPIRDRIARSLRLGRYRGVPGLQPGYTTQRVSSFEDTD